MWQLFYEFIGITICQFSRIYFFWKATFIIFFEAELEVAKLREVARLAINAHKDNYRINIIFGIYKSVKESSSYMSQNNEHIVDQGSPNGCRLQSVVL